MNDPLRQQIEYYRARAGEYDEWFFRKGRYDRGPEHNGRWFAEVDEVAAALDAFLPAGKVLELACGTGLWTERLARHAEHVTAVDASAEVLALNRERMAGERGRRVAGTAVAGAALPEQPYPPSARVDYVQADLFAWAPQAGRFDVVFFSFWLSHVPPERFERFWSIVGQALRPGGRFFLVDSRYAPSSSAVDHTLGDPEDTVQVRRLNDGREFEIYKIFYRPDALAARLAGLGWRAEVRETTTYFLYASGCRADAA
ncbi:MAG: class I SAM-dependent methyltransferase [Gammaproteobacteria bacterium]